MKVLPDTSVWVDYLRLGKGGPGAAVDQFLADGNIVTCGPVVAELVAGAREDVRSELWSLMAGLPWAELGRMEWRRTGETAAALRARGVTVALTDIEIAVAAIATGAALWTRDADFDRIVDVLPALELYVPPSS